MGFFRSFYLICYSPDSMQQLYRAGALKAWFHTLLAALCCALLSALIFCIVNCSGYSKAAKSFDMEFGGVAVTQSTITPANAPESGRTWFADPRTAVTYVPAAAELPDLPPEADKGVVWTPEAIFLWQYIGKTNAAVTWVRVKDYEAMNHTMEKSALLPTLSAVYKEITAEEPSPEKSGESSGGIFKVSSAFTTFFIMLSLFFALFYTVGYFLLANFLCGIFLIFSRFFKGRCSSLTCGEYWTVLLYTGFPAMLLGSVISGLGLDISYYMVYIFGMVIYLIFVLARLDKFLKETAE